MHDIKYFQKTFQFCINTVTWHLALSIIIKWYLFTKINIVPKFSSSQATLRLSKNYRGWSRNSFQNSCVKVCAFLKYFKYSKVHKVTQKSPKMVRHIQCILRHFKERYLAPPVTTCKIFCQNNVVIFWLLMIKFSKK